MASLVLGGPPFRTPTSRLLSTCPGAEWDGMCVIAVESKMEPRVETAVASQTVRVCRKVIDGRGRWVLQTKNRDHVMLQLLVWTVDYAVVLAWTRVVALILSPTASPASLVGTHDLGIGTASPQTAWGQAVLVQGGCGGWWVVCGVRRRRRWRGLVRGCCRFADLQVWVAGWEAGQARVRRGRRHRQRYQSPKKTCIAHCPPIAQRPNVWSQVAQSRREWPGTPSSQFIGDCESRRAWTARTASRTPATLGTRRCCR